MENNKVVVLLMFECTECGRSTYISEELFWGLSDEDRDWLGCPFDYSVYRGAEVKQLLVPDVQENN